MDNVVHANGARCATDKDDRYCRDASLASVLIPCFPVAVLGKEAVRGGGVGAHDGGGDQAGPIPTLRVSAPHFTQKAPHRAVPRTSHKLRHELPPVNLFRNGDPRTGITPGADVAVFEAR